MTTLTSYGQIGAEEQGRLVRAKKLEFKKRFRSQLKALFEAL